MSRKHAKKLGLVAAGFAGLMAADAAAPAQAEKLKSKDDCPQAAAIAIPNLIEARKSGNESSSVGTLRSRPKGKTTKKTARKKAAKKAAKKVVRKKPGRLKSAVKTRKKAAKRRTARRDPC